VSGGEYADGRDRQTDRQMPDHYITLSLVETSIITGACFTGSMTNQSVHVNSSQTEKKHQQLDSQTCQNDMETFSAHD